MSKPSDRTDNPDALRERIIGLGEKSIRKSYYPALKERVAELERFKALLDQIRDIIFVIDADTGKTVDVNESACVEIGYSKEDLLRIRPRHIWEGPVWEAVKKLVRDRGSAAGPEIVEAQIMASSSHSLPVEAQIRLTQFGAVQYVVIVARDISSRKANEEELRHAAKMEAIGRLAGGVAHDLNNLLTAMMGHANMLMLEAGEGGPQPHGLVQIYRAAERAATLTKKLLALSRKQVLDAQVVDLNRIISDLEAILRRVIGEDVLFRTSLDSQLGAVEADPGQIEQILMNLVVNARDAMPDGGRLTVETRNIALDEDSLGPRLEVKPGRYAAISVTDSGMGMDSETKSRIFDPFFTTKALGEGTGLGLSTAYGIIKQHKGHVTVYSEPGKGAVFKLYLPVVDREAEAPVEETAATEPTGGEETVLLVEDDEIVRDLAAQALQMLGYQVLQAAAPEEAIRIARERQGVIHLLLTDVGLPQMNGRMLFELISSVRPEIKALFISGYTEDAVIQHGILDKSVHFLQKPFSVEALSKKVRETLEGA